ncbi:PAS domain S-box protein [Mycolicibacterium fortuitum]|uniref:PAS domain S-box protein n=1 Tax=Mycolicibacterium fortuitum TaxID=1766 RepID=UPI001CE155F6|nr:PAS domain-containing protein [Mycolicibacterium fortuitum]
MERRQSGQDPQSPMTLLQNIPALVVLERFPVPVLAIAEDGTILFANTAFGEMVGRVTDAVKRMQFAEVFHSLPTDGSAVSVMRANAGLLVELIHHDGSIVRARMSKSALLRGDDPVALATFEDLTEQLWADEL